MIDYLSHVSALRVCLNALEGAVPSDSTNPKAIPEALAAAAREPGSAILGTLIDHLLQYSQAETSVEIGILSKAAALFKDGLAILDTFNGVRTSLEAGLTTPGAPGVLADFNAALTGLLTLSSDLQSLQSRLVAFQANASGNWMAPVGQQQDAPVAQWTWRDLFLARRTTAFVGNVQASATTNQERAFAFGVFAGAAGNLLGGGYLNAVVGGPRRSHQLRHRLAAYSVGAWLRDHEPQLAGNVASIKEAITLGQQGSTTLPVGIKTLLQQALNVTYPSGTATLPDLDSGYRRVLEHLRLLGDFTLPAVPSPMNNSLTLKVLGAGLVPGKIQTQDDPTDPNDPSDGSTWTDIQIGSHESVGQVCLNILKILALVVIVIVIVIAAAGSGSQTNQSGTQPGGVAPKLSLQELKTLGNSPDMLSAINSIYGAALAAWQALSAARQALVLRGWLYPEPDDLNNPTFTQFLSTPVSLGNYPLLAMPDSDDGTERPTSLLEAPATSPCPFSAFASPVTFLTGDPTYNVSALSSTLWLDMIEHPGSDREWSANLNLDSDRGFQAPCWDLAVGSTITSEPVRTNSLSFSSI